MSEDHLLNDTWTLYFHSAADSDWNTSSYKRIGEICSVEDFCNVYAELSAHLHKAIWFLFREHIFPMWDDSENLHGGCLSFKVLKQDAAVFWKHIGSRLLGETLLKEEHSELWSKVNGISISPKKHFVIIKIWTACQVSVDQFDIGCIYDGEVFYKPNLESISSNHQPQAKTVQRGSHRGDGE